MVDTYTMKQLTSRTLNCRLLYTGSHATSTSAITTGRRWYIYQSLGTTPAPAASVHLSADGSSPASAGTPISSSKNSSMAIISCRHRVREGIE